MNGTNFISTFSGCGGSSLGYKLAGFNELLAIDNDQNSVDTFKLNFDCPIWKRDIREVRGQEILDFLKIKRGDLSLLDGSPPCQGFSTAGKRRIGDHRNDLAYEFIRLVDELSPKVFVMENVSGMIKGKMAGVFKEINGRIKETNYNVKCKLLNAKYYRVPQDRERLFWIGIRKDLGIIPSFPEPNLNTISVKEALGRDGYIAYRRGYYKGKAEIKEWSFDNPCLTITKVNSWDVQPKPFTIDELKVLASFPKEFKFTEKYNDAWSRIGNAVMPKQMEAIAKHIKEIVYE